MTDEGSSSGGDEESDPSVDEATESSGFRFGDDEAGDEDDPGFQFGDDEEDDEDDPGFRFGDEGDGSGDTGESPDGDAQTTPEDTTAPTVEFDPSGSEPVDGTSSAEGSAGEDPTAEDDRRSDPPSPDDGEQAAADLGGDDEGAGEPYVEFDFDTNAREQQGTDPSVAGREDGSGRAETESDDRTGRRGESAEQEPRGREQEDDDHDESRLQLQRELQEMTLEEQFEGEQDDEASTESQHGETEAAAEPDERAEANGPGETTVDPQSGDAETDPEAAAILSFFVPGVGNLYSGETARGMVWLAAWLAWLVVGWGAGGLVFGIILGLATYGIMFLVTGVVLVMLEFVIHAVAAYDGYNRGEKINDGRVQV